MNAPMPTAMNCDDVAGLLDALIDGELAQPDRAAVTHPVERGASCGAAAARRQALSQRVASLGRYAPPPQLIDRLTAAIDRESAATASPGARGLWRPAPTQWFLTHGAAAAFGGLAVV